MVAFLVALFIFLTFLAFAGLKSRSGQNKIKYPSKVDCDHINNQFGDELDKYVAYAEYDAEPTGAMSGAGVYQCYCKAHSSKADFFSDGHLCQPYQ